jgi:erythromycin esterase-like protein
VRWREIGDPQDSALVEETLGLAKPFRNMLDLKPLAKKLGSARVVMLGESSHGTREFYDWRRILSQELIREHGFQFIAVEGDWPPCWEVNNFVHTGREHEAEKALRHFHRWPTWMWANSEVLHLAEWMHSHNSQVPGDQQAGFYGLDVYSLFESIDAAVKQLSTISPLLARRLLVRYSCFDPFRHDEVAYARSLLGMPKGCQEEVAQNLKELLELRLEREASSPFGDPYFNAAQNARVVADAENYYRTMVHGNEDSWNVRDRHMLDTLELLLEKYGPDSKGIVWAHNTHIGDYRATDMLAQGQVNIGGLAREKWGNEAVALVGFGTYEGEVIASTAWDGPVLRLPVPKGKPGSIESAFHKAGEILGGNGFYLELDRGLPELSKTRGHRAIGVVYHPDHEQFGNYVPTQFAHRYNAFLFLDRTHALTPLEQEFDRNEFPETWPQGL